MFSSYTNEKTGSVKQSDRLMEQNYKHCLVYKNAEYGKAHVTNECKKDYLSTAGTTDHLGAKLAIHLIC
jgi:hypothetical protein